MLKCAISSCEVHRVEFVALLNLDLYLKWDRLLKINRAIFNNLWVNGVHSTTQLRRFPFLWLSRENGSVKSHGVHMYRFGPYLSSSVLEFSSQSQRQKIFYQSWPQYWKCHLCSTVPFLFDAVIKFRAHLMPIPVKIVVASLHDGFPKHINGSANASF